MPTYDFNCDSCDYTTELISSVDDRNDLVGQLCPDCGDGHMVRAVTSVGVKVAMRAHEVSSKQSRHKQRIADKIKTIGEKRNKGTL